MRVQHDAIYSPEIQFMDKSNVESSGRFVLTYRNGCVAVCELADYVLTEWRTER